MGVVRWNQKHALTNQYPVFHYRFVKKCNLIKTNAFQKTQSYSIFYYYYSLE